MTKKSKRKVVKKLIKISLVTVGVVTTSILAKAIYNLKDVDFVD